MEKYEMFADVPGPAMWEATEAFAGLLRRHESGRWEGISQNTIFNQEELDKILAALPKGYSPGFPEEEFEDIEDERNYVKLPGSLDRAFGRIEFRIRRYEGDWPLSE